MLGRADHQELLIPKRSRRMTANAGIYSTGNSEEPDVERNYMRLRHLSSVCKKKPQNAISIGQYVLRSSDSMPIRLFAKGGDCRLQTAPPSHARRGKATQSHLKPTTSHVLGRGLRHASQVHARYMRHTSQVQATPGPSCQPCHRPARDCIPGSGFT